MSDVGERYSRDFRALACAVAAPASDAGDGARGPRAGNGTGSAGSGSTGKHGRWSAEEVRTCKRPRAVLLLSPSRRTGILQEDACRL